jgi:hypothetical protein
MLSLSAGMRVTIATGGNHRSPCCTAPVASCPRASGHLFLGLARNRLDGFSNLVIRLVK